VINEFPNDSLLISIGIPVRAVRQPPQPADAYARRIRSLNLPLISKRR
jgi:hypothetical protein